MLRSPHSHVQCISAKAIIDLTMSGASHGEDRFLPSVLETEAVDSLAFMLRSEDDVVKLLALRALCELAEHGMFSGTSVKTRLTGRRCDLAGNPSDLCPWDAYEREGQREND
jgi:hypothetical protein